MARIIRLGEPANDAERRAFAFLRDNLPANYTLLHNFEIVRGRQVYEVDLAILAPHCVFIVDIKGTQGQVDIYGSRWYPEGRQPFPSPLAKLRDHARVIKSMICDAHPARLELRRVYVQPVVLMTAPNAQVVDHTPDRRDEREVMYLNRSVAFFQGRAHIPNNFDTAITPLLSMIEAAMKGRARPRNGPQCFREYQVEQRLGSDNRSTLYRARHLYDRRGPPRLLRVYRIDPLLERETPAYATEHNRISNAFQALSRLPPHPNIVAVRDFFPTDDEDGFVLVTEETAGSALRQVMSKAELAQTLEQKLGILRDMLAALAHAHAHGVVHRNLTPDVILVGIDGVNHLTGFDYARVGENRSASIAETITNDLDPAYLAPEFYVAPNQVDASRATAASDLFAAGLIGYELLTGQPPFDTPQVMAQQQAVFHTSPSTLRPELPTELDHWLQRLCAYNVAERTADAAAALQALNDIVARSQVQAVSEPPAAALPPSEPRDLRKLQPGDRLGDRFIVQKYLGEGKFSVVYKIFDSFGDVDRAIKLITYDRHSMLARLRREYSALARLPEHPNIVRVIWADHFAGSDDAGTPYIVMEYAEGLTVAEFIESQALSFEDARSIATQVALGLTHIHRHGCYHQDIKPANLLWTDRGVRIIDFNVAISDEENQAQGGTTRYIPPDFEPMEELTAAVKIDRDLYALGVTLYECVTGHYPFAEGDDALRAEPRTPRDFPGCEDLSEPWIQLILKAIASRQTQRFATAEDFRTALEALPPIRRDRDSSTTTEPPAELPALLSQVKKNFNPFVSHLLTLYSQSRKTNAGTRGLDEIGKLTYVPTLLDSQLMPAVLSGEFRLVLISGNAGDGKTAFIQQLEEQATSAETIVRGPNGKQFVINGRTFYSNYDGSQDEGDKGNDEVLRDFFGSFAGNAIKRWPSDSTHLIAINEGRLIDFLSSHKERFPRLTQLVREGLTGGAPRDGVAVINLNLRSVVANTEIRDSSIFDRLLRRMIEPQFWQACTDCNLRDRCYIHHNARTFMDPVAGPHVIERLKDLYTITHMRGRLHITLRDLRSALAFMLVGTRDCDEVHALYDKGGEARQQIADGFYFNAWLGGLEGSVDRLVALLREIDMGETSNPEIDRAFDFLQPGERGMTRFSFEERTGYVEERAEDEKQLFSYDDKLLDALFSALPRQFDREAQREAIIEHQRYVAMLRRRYYFERRDDQRDKRRDEPIDDLRRGGMLPYRSTDRFLELVNGDADLRPEVEKLLHAINRGEGLSDPKRLGSRLALRVRQVDRATLRSYRLFDQDAFALIRPSIGASGRFIEYLPQGLIFSYQLPRGRRADLFLNLDVYDMLMRLNDGYRPSVEELEGFYRTLAVFKNVLASAPYQDVMLTENGYEFFRLRRTENGILTLGRVLKEQD
jgi:serine/threonine protein kinase